MNISFAVDGRDQIPTQGTKRMREKCTEGGLLLNITRVVGLCGGKAPQVNSLFTNRAPIGG